MSSRCREVGSKGPYSLVCSFFKIENIYWWSPAAAGSQCAASKNIRSHSASAARLSFREGVQKKRFFWEIFPKYVYQPTPGFLWDLGKRKLKYWSKRRFSGWFGGVWRGLDLVWESDTPPTHIWERYPPKKTDFFFDTFPKVLHQGKLHTFAAIDRIWQQN